MLNRVKGATPFERRDGIKRDNPPLLSVERRQTRRSISIERNSTAVDAKFEFASLRKRSTSKARSATEKKAFCARQKISFHHTLKTRPRQPRARRNNATFLAKILAFSTKPSVSVVFSPQIELRRLNRRRFAGTSADKKNKQWRPFCVFVQIRGEIGRRSTRSPPTF